LTYGALPPCAVFSFLKRLKFCGVACLRRALIAVTAKIAQQKTGERASSFCQKATPAASSTNVFSTLVFTSLVQVIEVVSCAELLKSNDILMGFIY